MESKYFDIQWGLADLWYLCLSGFWREARNNAAAAPRRQCSRSHFLNFNRFSFPNKSFNKYQQPCRRDPDTTARATTTIPPVERIRRRVRAITVSMRFVLLDLCAGIHFFLAPKGTNLDLFGDTRSQILHLAMLFYMGALDN